MSFIAPLSVIDPSAKIGKNVQIKARAVISSGVEIADNTVIGEHSFIAENVVIGKNTSIGRGCFISHAMIENNVTIGDGVKIGQKGFGYVPDKGKFLHVPQLGIVTIKNHTTILANSCVDRGSSDTIIGEKVAIEGLVQVAHNVRIGNNSKVQHHSGVSGSSSLGENVSLEAKVGLVNHLKIGNRASLGFMSTYIKDLADDQRIEGYYCPMSPEDHQKMKTVIQELIMEENQKGAA